MDTRYAARKAKMLEVFDRIRGERTICDCRGDDYRECVDLRPEHPRFGWGFKWFMCDPEWIVREFLFARLCCRRHRGGRERRTPSDTLRGGRDMRRRKYGTGSYQPMNTLMEEQP